MLNRYLNVKRIEIPTSNGFYSIGLDGVIKNIYDKEEHNYINRDGDLVVMINLWSGYKEYAIAFLVAISFKPIHIPVEQWNNIGVIFADLNNLNIHPKNLIWKFPPNGIRTFKYPSYRIIPGFTRYAINRKGDVVGWITGEFRNKYSNKGGYIYYSVRSDITNKLTGTGRHRLLCLAWKDYGHTVNKLEVNHINGIPGSDDLDNLEWVTRKENCDHAFKYGLHNTNTRVLVRNVITNEITEYYSYGDCGRHLGCDPGHIRQRTLTANQPVFTGNLQFKLKTDPTPWRTIDPTELEFKSRSGIPLGIKAYCLETRQEFIYRSITHCADSIKRDRTSIAKCLYSANSRPIKGYMYKWITDTTPWVEYSDAEVAALREYVSGRRILVKDLETNEINQFHSLKDAAKALGVKTSNVYYNCKKGHILKQRYKLSYVVNS